MLEKEGKEKGYRYDPRGNLTGILENGVLKNQYNYGALNRLEEAENPSGQSAWYDYNGLGFRVGKEVRSGSQEPRKKIQYTLDLTRSYHNLLEREEDNRTQMWPWDGNTAGMVEEGRNAGSGTEAGTQADYQFYLQDELGSPIRFADAEGNLTETYGYGVFGEDLYQNQGKVQPFGYTGYQKDEVAGTYFAQAREYLPEVGRFGAKDVDIFIKIGETISINQYIYCKVNPVNYIDLEGYDSYVFYDPENFKNAANSEKERLEEEYGAPVHFIAIDTNTELAEQWNNIKDKKIDEISLLFHGQPHALIINEEKNLGLTTNVSGITNRGTEAIYIGDLKNLKL